MQFVAEDVRYTQSKCCKMLYAVSLGLPKDKLTLTAVKVDKAGPGAKVTMLGCDEAMRFSVNGKKQLVIDASAMSESKAPCKFAYSFKLAGFDLDIQADAIRKAPKTKMVHD